MKNIKFIETEIESIIEIIELGNSHYDKSFTKYGESLLPKIQNKIFAFSPKEVQVLRSYTSHWLNENEQQINELFEKYWNKNVNNYLKVDEAERFKMQKIDLIHNIKSKLTSTKYKTFGKVFEKIDKLRKVENIYISIANDGKPYKIAFVDLKQNQILKFELNSLNNFENIDFTKMNKSELHKTGYSYSKICNKRDAFQIFAKYNEKHEDETFEFCRALLN